MMKIIDSDALLDIADDIRNNCEVLSCSDAEEAEDDIAYYVPIIQQLAEDLVDIVAAAAEIPNGGNAG